ncbi:ATP-grasp domain-containing protein [Pleionea sp. CnH1-48]|uniref:ATP-grasp domain-containing protein n=1 Tax=Pleionea sp. CnH1-48 TaxID=2954494 RepID=UPI003530676E
MYCRFRNTLYRLVDSEIRCIDHYDGEPNVEVSRSVILSAIKELDKAKESYAGYAIDFGVLSTGETALVEMNDGFAVGAYEIGAKDYTDMVIARWEELLDQGNC